MSCTWSCRVQDWLTCHGLCIYDYGSHRIKCGTIRLLRGLLSLFPAQSTATQTEKKRGKGITLPSFFIINFAVFLLFSPRHLVHLVVFQAYVITPNAHVA